MTASNKGPQHVGLLVALTALVFAVFVALGTWQFKRLSWKLDLISHVNQRAYAKEVAAPSPEQWPQLNASNDEYRRIRVIGIFIAEQDTLVQAVTDLGSGFWVLTPLRLADGTVIMVNRGFIPPEAARVVAPPIADIRKLSTVTGLLRMTQPGGAFLRQNDPMNRRWYSRDVQAIAEANGLTQVAPYFVDADSPPTLSAELPVNNGSVAPVGGLTVIAFHNNHLVYALTWYTLAAMVGAAAWYFSNTERRRHHDKTSEGLDRVAGD